MTFSEYTRENTPISARPECPMCAVQMYLARIEPEKPRHDQRTFECPRCQHVETVPASRSISPSLIAWSRRWCNSNKPPQLAVSLFRLSIFVQTDGCVERRLTGRFPRNDR